MHHNNKTVDTHLRYNSCVARLLKIIVHFLFKRYIRFKTDTTLISKSSSEPFLLLSPYTTVWYPSIIGYHVHRKLHYVASDAHFRRPFLRSVLQQLGTIAKEKNMLDPNAVREILYVLSDLKEPVCIFPEGANTWDGAISPILTSIAKLVKQAKIPVVVAQAPHAHLVQPRWAVQRRKIPITITYTTILTPEHIATMDERALCESITKTLYYNAYDQQRDMPIIIHSNCRAEYLERLLFFCPHCHGVQQIHSKGNHVYCLQCCNIWHVSVYGFLHLCKRNKSTDTPIILQHGIHPSKINPTHAMNATDDIITPVVWNTWQQQFMAQYIDRRVSAPEQIIFIDNNVLMFVHKGHNTKKIGTGTFMMSPTTMQFKPHTSSTAPVTMPVNAIKGINIQNNEKLECYYDDVLYTLQSKQTPKQSKVNTYKYMCAVQYLQQRTKHST